MTITKQDDSCVTSLFKVKTLEEHISVLCDSLNFMSLFGYESSGGLLSLHTDETTTAINLSDSDTETTQLILVSNYHNNMI